MTEIPEHLLRRSRERREALGLAEPGEAPGATADAPAESAAVEVAGSTAPAPAAAATPAVAPPPPPPPKPPPPHVQAAFDRKRIPFWAMPVLAALPVWAFIFAFTLEPPSRGEGDPLTQGEELYQGNCASCHGANGQGGVGPAFQDGAVIATWPDYKQHIQWVHLGSTGWPGGTYGAQDKPKQGGMPPFGQTAGGTLTDLEIALIVRYEREVLAGADPEPELVEITEELRPPLDAEGNPSAEAAP